MNLLVKHYTWIQSNVRASGYLRILLPSLKRLSIPTRSKFHGVALFDNRSVCRGDKYDVTQKRKP